VFKQNAHTLSLLPIIILASISAYGQQPNRGQNPLQLNRDQVEIATVNQKTPTIISVNKNLIKSEFEDGIKIKDVRVQKQGAKFYLVLEGANEKIHRISRIELSDAGDGHLTMSRMAGTESCEGVGCQKCSFADGGGCKCDEPSGDRVGKPAGICNHTTTRPTPSRTLLRDVPVSTSTIPKSNND
jgi:hypothetical protein